MIPFPHRLLPLGLLGLPLLLPLAGCDVGPDYHRPQSDVPAAFTSPGAQATEAGGPAPLWPSPTWWEGFGSPELNQLMQEAEAHNYSVQGAIAAVEAADAAVRVAGGALLPAVTGAPGVSWSQVNAGGNSSTGGAVVNGSGTITRVGTGVVDTRTYSAELSASYEIDFWGKNRATFQAAEASAMSARYAAQVTALTVVAEVADTYFSALSFQDQIRVAEANLKIAEDLLKVEQGRL
ncbi:MAG TPA: TolC family protein, partial [Acidisoma sp.]|nr:TolC family protein [Acidisoma sp.]